MRYVHITLLVLLLLAGAGVLNALAADQVRSTETLVYSSNTAVSGNVNAPFSVYVGDNLGGIANPLKSLSFLVSGVYTVGGFLTLTIDSDAATSQAFTLPSVSAPTPFEFVYQDPSGKINPSSAGSYDYILNLVPSGGIIMTTFGVRMRETHRYAPPTCADGSTQKVKTNEFLVVSSNTAVSVPRTDSFSLYLGDNMAGITTPLKSLQFTVSGVYTGAGGGTVIMSLNNDLATEQIFPLPSVSAPTHFEFIYSDPTGSISPTSAGSYTYTITTDPAGVVLYQLGITARETHRYVPPTCGGGLPIYGDLTSAVFETTGSADGAAYNSIMWKGTPGTGKVKFQFATSPNSTGPWTFRGGSTCGTGDFYDTGVLPTGGADKPVEISCANQSDPPYHNNQRYYKYKIRICSNADCATSGTESPIVTDVVVNWAP